MSDMTDPFSRSVVLKLPATDAVTVRSNLRWGVEDDQLFDVYRPPQFEGLRLPLVVLVTGYADPGFKVMTGRRMKDTAPYESWARLIASSGLVAVTYANHDPVPDATGVLRYLTDHADELGDRYRPMRYLGVLWQRPERAGGACWQFTGTRAVRSLVLRLHA